MVPSMMLLSLSLVLGQVGKLVDPVAERPVVPPAEVCWWSASNEFLVAVWPDGLLGIYDLDKGDMVSSGHMEKLREHGDGCFLTPGPPPVLGMVTTGATDNVMTFWQLPDRRELGDVLIENSAGLYILGVGDDAKTVYCASGLADMAFAVDVSLRKIKWRMELPVLTSTGESVSPDGNTLVRFGSHGSVVARTPEGKLLWEKKYASEDMLEPNGCVTLGLSSVIAAFRDSDSRVVALRWKDGMEVWTRKVEGITDLCGISQDGLTQVFHSREGVEMTHLPEKDATRLPWSHGCPEAVFTPDSKRILLFAELEEVRKSKKVKERRRPSHEVMVLDSKTGAVKKTFALDKPAGDREPPASSQPASRPAKGRE